MERDYNWVMYQVKTEDIVRDVSEGFFNTPYISQASDPQFDT